MTNHVDRETLNQEQIEALRRIPARDVRLDLVCPDCLAPMILRVGKFGRFYGCSEFPYCRTGVSADEHGNPHLTELASKDVRRSRHRLMVAVRHLSKQKLKLPPIPSKGIGSLNIEECEVLLEEAVQREPWLAEFLVEIPRIWRKDRYQRLMDDDDVLDTLLFGVASEKWQNEPSRSSPSGTIVPGLSEPQPSTASLKAPP